MNYELVSVIRPEDNIWAEQRKRLKDNNGQVISVSPSPNFNQLKKREGVEGINVLDYVTKRTHDSEKFLFFNQVPTATSAEIFMNEDRSISLINDGDEIGRVSLYPGTRRHVREVTYLNTDQSTDFIEEYADDGALFSNIFFHDGKIQEIDFYNDSQIPVLTYFFYEGQINFVTIRDTKTFGIKKSFANTFEFISEQVAKIAKKKDTISISYMGLELFALSKSKSHNILYLEESPLDENEDIKGNLLGILKDSINYVHEVKMKQGYFNELKNKQVPLDKVTIIS